MPLLGMELAWTPRDAAKHWNREKAEPMKKTIARLAKAGARTVFHDKSRETVSDGRKKIKLAHGSFDNDVEAVSRMHATILGRKTLPTARWSRRPHARGELASPASRKRAVRLSNRTSSGHRTWRTASCLLR
ncbi:MAG: hypothetical protein Q7W02_19185 [Candidatus Rokubacteria bacterium]|nr:hypothetical protein [Candidatus Rokubacteria bacterium]